jgi:hypothetical protein
MSTELYDFCTHSGTMGVCGHKVSYKWWGGFVEDKINILDQEARDQISEMIPQSYVEGELTWEGESLQGSWEIQKEGKR